MTTAHKHQQQWWESLDEDGLEVDLRHLRGMSKVIAQGLVPSRSEERTARGNHRYPKHFYASR
jgi:hypothetical protein